MARSLRCQLCDATQFPMIQKMEKTGEFLQVQHIAKVIGVLQTQLIDEAVKVPEIMQRHDPMFQEVEDAQKTCKTKPKRSSRCSADTGSSERKELCREVHKRDTQDTCETSVRRSATMQQDPNVSPQANQAPSAKTRLTMSSHEPQPTKRRQKCLKHERESSTAPPDVWTRMSESRRAR